jgi:hypothetical protein
MIEPKDPTARVVHPGKNVLAVYSLPEHELDEGLAGKWESEYFNRARGNLRLECILTVVSVDHDGRYNSNHARADCRSVHGWFAANVRTIFKEARRGTLRHTGRYKQSL